MMADRSVSKVFSDIIGNAQEIIRAEILLARTAALDEVFQAKQRIAMLVSGVVAGIFAALFLLVSAFHALTQVLPAWSSALIVAAAMAVVAAILLQVGMKAVEHPPGDRHPVEIPKENHT
jgi:predicted membrane-bound dolichyl-phosphate-mannose-protein mannosyltransferase